jgi:Tfp pilus assembly protein PilV
MEEGRMVNKIRSQGLSLAELLIAVAILAYCLSPMMATFINSVALNDSSRNLLTATSHAEYVMESIKSKAFSEIPGAAAEAVWSAWTFNTSGVTGLGLTALKAESITTTLAGINPVDISVTVSWADAGGRSRSIQLRTVISG